MVKLFYAVFKEKQAYKSALAAKAANFFSNGFQFWLDERSNNMTTDRQTDKFFDTNSLTNRSTIKENT